MIIKKIGGKFQWGRCLLPRKGGEGAAQIRGWVVDVHSGRTHERYATDRVDCPPCDWTPRGAPVHSTRRVENVPQIWEASEGFDTPADGMDGEIEWMVANRRAVWHAPESGMHPNKVRSFAGVGRIHSWTALSAAAQEMGHGRGWEGRDMALHGRE